MQGERGREFRNGGLQPPDVEMSPRIREIHSLDRRKIVASDFPRSWSCTCAPRSILPKWVPKSQPRKRGCLERPAHRSRPTASLPTETKLRLPDHERGKSEKNGHEDRGADPPHRGVRFTADLQQIKSDLDRRIDEWSLSSPASVIGEKLNQNQRRNQGSSIPRSYREGAAGTIDFDRAGAPSLEARRPPKDTALRSTQCQKISSRMMIGSGMPISHSKMPLPTTCSSSIVSLGIQPSRGPAVPLGG